MEDKKRLYDLFQTIQEHMKNNPVKTEKSNAFNIFKVLGIADKEVLICRLLGELLDPNGSHGLNEKPLLAFLEQLNIADQFSLDAVEKAHTVLEETVDGDRRVDVVTYIGSSAIPIEVKIWAGDQANQLYDYYQYFAKVRPQNKTLKIYYLTPGGRAPSDGSISGPDNHQRLSSGQYQCLSFREDVSRWIDRLLGECGGSLGEILRQFQEVINDMCSEDTILQSIKEAVHLGEGHFERNSSLEALLLILEANKTNELWKVIRKEYLRQNLQFDKTRYQLIDVSEEEKGHAIFAVRALETGKQIAWICVDTNLYIVANALKPQYENQPEWKKENGSVWRYVSPHGGNERFPLRNPTTSIITESTLAIGDLLDQISS